MTEINFEIKKSGSTYISSIVFLVIVIISTIGLYFYNNYLLEKIDKLTLNINSIESNISEVEKDKSLQVYSLLELNKVIIDSYNDMNKVTKYINHMNVIQGKYNLEFIGFNLSKGEINTNVKVISDDEGIAYVKTKDFINKYRSDTKALFDLGFVNSVEGMDNMQFKVNFKIK